MLTLERMREVLRCGSDGRIYWVSPTSNRVHAGDQAGSMRFNGYWWISIDGESYPETWLVWLWNKGKLPDGHLDHIDGNTWNNRLSNLREATTSQNLANSKTFETNTSGYKGVCWHKQHQKWRAYIVVSKKQHHLGLFTELHDAARAYRDAALKYFGEFARHNHPGVSP